MSERSCIVLIGMAASGKSTVGRELAAAMHLAHLDSDAIIEATYGARLQYVTDALGKEAFLDLESAVIRSLNLRRTIVSSGGSVVYRPDAMSHLTEMGVLIHLDVPLPVILERIARKPDRGLALAPGQTIEELFAERDQLYRRWAEYSVPCGGMTVPQTVQAVLDYLSRVHPELCEVPAEVLLPPVVKS